MMSGLLYKIPKSNSHKVIANNLSFGIYEFINNDDRYEDFSDMGIKKGDIVHYSDDDLEFNKDYVVESISSDKKKIKIQISSNR